MKLQITRSAEAIGPVRWQWYVIDSMGCHVARGQYTGYDSPAAAIKAARLLLKPELLSEESVPCPTD